MPNSTTLSLRSRLMWRIYKMPLHKRILCIAVPILIILAIPACIVVGMRASKTFTLNNEIRELLEIGASGNEEDFYNRCETIKSTEPYYITVERSTKKYLCALTRDTNELLAEFDDGGMVGILETDAIAADDEIFSNGRQKLASARELIQQKRDRLYNYFSYEGALEFLDADASELAASDFLSRTINERDMDGAEAIYRSLINMIDDMISVYEEALDYLAAHRGDWSIEGTVVAFEHDDELAEYWAILDKADAIARNYSEKYLITDEKLAEQDVVEVNQNESDLSNFVIPVFH